MGPKCAIAHPMYVSNSRTKTGWISSNGLGGDNITDRRTDGGNNNIPFAFLKKRGDNNRAHEVSMNEQVVQLSKKLYNCVSFLSFFNDHLFGVLKGIVSLRRFFEYLQRLL